MSKICTTTLQTVKVNDVITTDFGRNQFGLIHSIVTEDKTPVSLEIFPIITLPKGETPSDDTLRMIPIGLAKEAKLPYATKKNFWISPSTTTYTPVSADSFLMTYTASRDSHFAKSLFWEITDQKIAAIKPTAPEADKPNYTKPASHVIEAKKPTGARILDIPLEDVAEMKLCAADAAFITILKNAKFTRLKTAFKLASSPADADKLHQIYEATTDAPITFSQFRKDIKAAWKKVSALIDNQDPRINHDHLWFTSDEKIGFKFTDREPDLNIDDAKTTNYIKSKYLPDVLKTMGLSSFGDAFLSANETPKEFKQALKKIAPDMNPEAAMDDIIHGWESFQVDVTSHPYELADTVRVFYPRKEIA